jgi:polyphenol oxidase
MGTVIARFTDRWGGASTEPYDSLNLGDHVGDAPRSVEANRAAVSRDLGVEAIAWMNQVHGDRVVVVEDLPRPGDAVPECDALVTATAGVALGVLVADCVPVLMSDAMAGVVAAVHAGRLGTRADVVLRALETMTSLGADPASVRVLLGPAVCGACYEVPQDMQRAFVATVPEALSTTRWGTPGLDLRAGLRGRLAGRVASIEVDDRCTRESPDLFSHRRDGVTGRTAGVVRFVA